MKLLRKTNISYLVLAIPLFAVGAIFLFMHLRSVIDEDVNEELYVDKLRIVRQIESGEPPPQLYPLIEVNKTDVSKTIQYQFSDTVMLDPVENEYDPFRQLYSVAQINDSYYEIIVRTPLLDTEDLYSAIGVSIGALLIILLAGILIINHFISKSIWKPFYKNLEKLKGFSLNDNGSLEIEPSSIHEFRELNQVIGDLTDRVTHDYMMQKEFTENASHELQTPLTIILSKLEMAIGKGDLNPEQASRIVPAYEAARRLSKLNQALLLLTKIENNQYSERNEISINELVKKTIEANKEKIEALNIIVNYQAENEVTLNINPSLAEMLVNNLTGNAIKHNLKENGHIWIEISDHQLIIKNTGTASEIERETMFQRFKKDNPSSPSLGLGLSIIKKICELNDFEISYSHQNDIHKLQIIFELPSKNLQ